MQTGNEHLSSGTTHRSKETPGAPDQHMEDDANSSPQPQEDANIHNPFLYKARLSEWMSNLRDQHGFLNAFDDYDDMYSAD